MTPDQVKTLDFVRDRIERAGFAPTQCEIAEAIGTSRPTAMQHVHQLAQLGLLRRQPHRHRGLDLADRPDLRAVGTDALRAELARRGKTMDALSDRTPRSWGGRPCAADCCEDRVGRGHLFCRDHWFAIPEDLRGAILNAFGAKDERGYGDAVAEARDFLQTGRRWGAGR